VTKGYTDAAGVTGGFQLEPGIRISGAGIDNTVVQLVPRASSNTPHYFAFGHALSTVSQANPMDRVEISDLTVDCSFTVKASRGTAACGAVRLM